MNRFFIFFLVTSIFVSCNADPKKLAGKRKKTSKKVTKKKVEERGTGFFGSESKDLRIALRPVDVDGMLKKRLQIGVLYTKGDHARSSLRLIETSEKSDQAACDVDWYLDIWTGHNYSLLEIMWKCKRFRWKGSIWSMSTSAFKAFSSLITNARLHPDRWLAIVKVPVIHAPSTITSSVREFVEETVPLEYDLTRYPSFKVITEYAKSIPQDLSTLDSEVKELRDVLRKRLEDFKLSAQKRSSGIIRRILPPISEKEVFSRELNAIWSMTIICNLGTNTDRIYWMSQFKNVWVKSITIPTHYRMMFVKKDHKSGPTFNARISALDLDPPLEY